MKSIATICVLLLLLFGTSHITAAENKTGRQSPPSYDEARKAAWIIVESLIPKMAEVNEKEFPGTAAWHKDFGKLTQGVGKELAVQQWPKVDLDELIDHNPNYWRMIYETQPGDPVLLLVHACVLISQGEPRRAVYVLELVRHEPGIPKEIATTIDPIQRTALAAMNASNAATQKGTELFDAGDYDGAMKKYDEALKLCPQNGWTFYEMGYTLRTIASVARGEKQDAPGTVIANGKFTDTPEITELFAKARHADPLQFNAYQGKDPAVIAGFLALGKKALPTMKQLHENAGKRMAVYYALRDLSEGLQEAGVDDLALLARQLMIAQRRNYDPADHPFICKSLRRLAPGKTTELVLLRLNDKDGIKARVLTQLDKVDGENAFGVEPSGPESDSPKVQRMRGYMPDKAPSKTELEKPVQIDFVRLITTEDEIQKRTSAEDLGAFIKKFEAAADDVLGKGAAACNLRVRFECTPEGRKVTIAHKQKDIDKKMLQSLYEAVEKIDKVKIKSDKVEFEIQLTVTPKN